MAWFIRQYTDYFDKPIDEKHPVAELMVAHKKFTSQYTAVESTREKNIELVQYLLFLVRYFQRTKILCQLNKVESGIESLFHVEANDYIQTILQQSPLADDPFFSSIQKSTAVFLENVYLKKGVHQPRHNHPKNSQERTENLLKITASILYLSRDAVEENKDIYSGELQNIIHEATNLRVKAGAISTLIDLHKKTKIMKDDHFRHICDDVFSLLGDSTYDTNNVFSVLIAIMKEPVFSDFMTLDQATYFIEKIMHYHQRHKIIPGSLILIEKIASHSGIVFHSDMQKILNQVAFDHMTTYDNIDQVESVFKYITEDSKIDHNDIHNYFPNNVLSAVTEEELSPMMKEEWKFQYQHILNVIQISTDRMRDPLAKRKCACLLFALGKKAEIVLSHQHALACYQQAQVCGLPVACLKLAIIALENKHNSDEIASPSDLLFQSFEMALEERKMAITCLALNQIAETDSSDENKLTLVREFISRCKKSYAGEHPGIFWDSLFVHVNSWKGLKDFKNNVIADMLLEDCHLKCVELLEQPLVNKGKIERWLERLQQFGIHYPEYGHFAHLRSYLEKDYLAARAHHEQQVNEKKWTAMVKNMWSKKPSPLLKLARAENSLAAIYLWQLQNGDQALHSREQEELINLITTKLVAPLYTGKVMNKSTEQAEPLYHSLQALSPEIEHYYRLARLGFQPALTLIEMVNSHLAQASDKPPCWHEFIVLNTELHAAILAKNATRETADTTASVENLPIAA